MLRICAEGRPNLLPFTGEGGLAKRGRMRAMRPFEAMRPGRREGPREHAGDAIELAAIRADAEGDLLVKPGT